jgi:hypothetical protein
MHTVLMVNKQQHINSSKIHRFIKIISYTAKYFDHVGVIFRVIFEIY